MKKHNSPAISKRLTGLITYWGPENSFIGKEHFDLFFHQNGHSFRAFCEMDDINLLRDVSVSFTQVWQPIDGFCRITQNGKVLASNWFVFNKDKVNVKTCRFDGKEISQEFSNNPPYVYLGLHPLQGDALITTQVDKSSPGEYIQIKGITNSISENGDQGLTAMPVNIDVAYLENEELTVAAGCFNARKYALRWQPHWPPAYVWVREEDSVFLKMTWEKINNWYELTELSET